MSIPWKAVFAFFGTVLGSFLLLTEDATNFDSLTGFQWLMAVLISVAMAMGVYTLPK